MTYSQAEYTTDWTPTWMGANYNRWFITDGELQVLETTGTNTPIYGFGNPIYTTDSVVLQIEPDGTRYMVFQKGKEEKVEPPEELIKLIEE